MGYKDLTFMSYPFKFSPVDREQKLNFSPGLLNGIIVGGLQWTSSNCDLTHFLVMITENALN